MIAFKARIIKKILIAISIVGIIVGAVWYIADLRAKLAISELTSNKLSFEIQTQHRLIEQMNKDIKQIQTINFSIAQLVEQQHRDIQNITDMFTTDSRGNPRNFGLLAATKPQLIETIVNKGSQDAFRCLELASGADHTRQELSAKTKNEINSMCANLANPFYIKSDQE